jgi:UDP-N-acetylglucosamine 2-epimerase (non-hydrolysing)
MDRIRAMIVVGARPQFIKSAPVIREILSGRNQIDLSVIHSGQHYDREMSEIFFRELRMPRALLNLRAGSGSHAVQTARIMERLEGPILEKKPDVLIVPGDTNTTLAASLTAAKLSIPVAHIEAGMRSGDMTMPEEINRKLTDHCSTLLFAPTRTAFQNLMSEGLKRGLHLTGDTMVDALRIVVPIIQQREDMVLAAYGLQPHQYVLVTLHRPSNVDPPARLRRIQLALRKVGAKLPIIFLVHPRTRVRLAKLCSATQADRGLVLTSPKGYIETLCLLKSAGCLLTDSGGMQKESFMLHTPCVTLRSTTEWPETLRRKANQLLIEPEMIPHTVLKTAFDKSLREAIRDLKNPFGDGHASSRIARIIQTLREN